MAYPVVDTSRIASILPQLLDSKIVETANRSATILQVIGHESSGNKNLAWDTEFKNAAEATDSSIAEGADVATYQDDDLVQAVLNWKTYSEAISVTGLAMTTARGTAGGGAGVDELQDLWAQKMLRAVRRLGKNIGKDFWVGPGTGNRVLGLYGGSTLTSGAPLSNAGTYAGISRVTYTDWKANVLLNGGTQRALTFDLMRRMRRTIYEAGGEMPDMIVCDAEQHEAYGRLFGAERRYVEDITVRGRKVTLDGGYKALEFDGIPVIVDVNHPAGYMSWLNSNYVKLVSSTDAATAANRSPGFVDLQVTPEEFLKSGYTGLRARLNPLAVTGDLYKIQMLLYWQPKLVNPKMCGVLGDLAVGFA